MKPKNVLILSILAGLLAVVLVRLQMQRERGEAVKVFRATATVEPGQTLGDRWEEYALPSELYPNVLKGAPKLEMREYVTSTPLRERVHEGQVILFQHLEASADPGLRSQIPAGMKAIAIEVDAALAVGYLVEPEDRVDVLAAMPTGDGEDRDVERLRSRFARETGLDADLLADMMGPDFGSRLETGVLVDDVEVLAVGRRYRRAEPGDPTERFDTVTLLVTRDEAERLAHAREVVGATMTLVLRSPADDPDDGERVRKAAG